VPIWIPLTVAAAFLQNWRSALQKELMGSLSLMGSTAVRFFFAVPFAGLYLLLAWGHAGRPALPVGPVFYGWCTLGGLAQIGATAALLGSFTGRSFAVGTALSKTETIQAAAFGLLFLGDRFTGGALAGIAVSLGGVLLLTVAPAPGRAASPVATGPVSARPVLLGLVSGAAFAVAAVSYRAASLSLGLPGFALPALTTLCSVLLIQSAVCAVWLATREPGMLATVGRNWRTALRVGFAGASASVGWFSAMTLVNAAYVRALGQVELLFTFAASHRRFGERATPREIVGVSLVVGGIVLLLLLR
jgi:drug/metabolite transporter (DMT)-like permease